MPLAEYNRKRRFNRTPEPKGARPQKRKSRLEFVVQKHDASRLHYDFRLEFDGVLKSWAVPKGPSLDPADKRLAVEVEDHPLEYGTFEGNIPQGEYGGGTVLLWDRGTWHPAEDPAAGLRAGKLKFTLSGEKLHGGWTLVRIRSRDGDAKNWLLIKERDKFARLSSEYDVLECEPESVKSGQDLKSITATNSKVRKSKSKKKVAITTRAASQGTRVRLLAPAASRDGTQAEMIAEVRLTHPDRVLFPEVGITKRGLAEYFVEIADWILPQLQGRPLALVRCPAGEGKQCFYQKHPGKGSPAALQRVEIQEKHKVEEYAVINDVAGLVSLVQMGVLEIHPWGSRTDQIERPDRLIFDLDPAEDVPWSQVIAAARQLRELLGELDLRSFLKTTGGKGLHLVVPIDRRHEWPQAKQFTKGVVIELVRRAPQAFTANMSKAGRTGKIFLDYLRNDRGATAVAAYSTRAKPGAPVSTPIDWKELTPKLYSDHFSVTNVPKRLARLAEDPWKDLASTRQSITAAAVKRLGQFAS